MDAPTQTDVTQGVTAPIVPGDVIEVIELEADELANFDAINMCPD